MAYKRAMWRSGLIYERTCERCKVTFRYMDDKLEFRPWYADGFVYCPQCASPLRHNEMLAVTDANGQPIARPAPVEAPPAVVPAPAPVPAAGRDNFCPDCGNAYREGDRFCAQCGRKR